MESTTYEAENETEAQHWWFVGRRILFGRIINGIDLQTNASILDVGSSTGTNLRLLESLGHKNVKGLDPSSQSRDFCAEKGMAEVIIGDVLNIPFEEDSTDLVLATDILEHVDEDELAAKEIHRILKPGGYALLTVPAFQCLWGIQDDVSQHKRRYKKSRFCKIIKSAGFEIQKAFYFNYFLFIPIFLMRLILKLFKPSIRAETDINSPIINQVLLSIFTIDIMSAEFIRPPFGVSILILCKKSL